MKFFMLKMAAVLASRRFGDPLGGLIRSVVKHVKVIPRMTNHPLMSCDLLGCVNMMDNNNIIALYYYRGSPQRGVGHLAWSWRLDHH